MTPKTGSCLALYNHWSYVGIGWSLGIESCIQSVEDSLSMAELPPHIPVGINMDAEAFVIMAELRPDLMRKLKRFCETGRAEVVGGSYGQPLGSMIGGESNIRQLLLGRKRIREATGIDVTIFLEEEEFSHPQLPQILLRCGFFGASLSQCDTWGYAGVPSSPHSAIRWRGVDGSAIRCATANGLHYHPPSVTPEIPTLLEPEKQRQLQDMAELDGFAPLVQVWTEFGWEKIAGQMINKFDRNQYVELAQRMPVDFCTLGGYLARLPERLPTEQYRMDDFHKMLAWGIGADQLRRNDRKTEQMLLALEALDCLLRLERVDPPAIDFEPLWEDLLASQSHDVSLCEFSRWQGGMPPEQAYFPPQYQTWGAIGMQRQYRCLHAVKHHCAEAMRVLAEKIGGVVVVNTSGSERDGLASLNNQKLPEHPALEWPNGDIRPLQHLAGAQEHGTAIFEVPEVSGFGWISGRIVSRPGVKKSPLRVSGDTLENDAIRIRLRRSDGRVIEFFDRRRQRNLLDETVGFGRIRGILNQLPDQSPLEIDSGCAPVAIEIAEAGPVRGKLKIHWSLPAAAVEMTVALAAHGDAAEIGLRMKTNFPPMPEVKRRDSWQLVHTPTNGIWLEFKPAFPVARVVRDYPFGVEATEDDGFSALTFADFRGDGAALTCRHGGTQYWTRRGDGCCRNLLMREWEAGFTGYPGWPIYSEFHYQLQAGDGTASFRELARKSEFSARELLAAQADAADAPALPAARRVLNVHGGADGVMLRYDRESEQAELRTVEYEGKAGVFGLKRADTPDPEFHECDFEGNSLAGTSAIRPFGIQAWRFSDRGRR